MLNPNKLIGPVLPVPLWSLLPTYLILPAPGELPAPLRHPVLPSQSNTTLLLLLTLILQHTETYPLTPLLLHPLLHPSPQSPLDLHPSPKQPHSPTTPHSPTNKDKRKKDADGDEQEAESDEGDAGSDTPSVHHRVRVTSPEASKGVMASDDPYGRRIPGMDNYGSSLDHFYIMTATSRHETIVRPKLEARRLWALYKAQIAWRDSESPPPHYLPWEAVTTYPTEEVLDTINSMMIGIPTEQSNKYQRLEPKHWPAVKKGLEDYAEYCLDSCSNEVRKIWEVVPLPESVVFNESPDVTGEDLELLCVLWREEVENWMADLYQIKTGTPPVFRSDWLATLDKELELKIRSELISIKSAVDAPSDLLGFQVWTRGAPKSSPDLPITPAPKRTWEPVKRTRRSRRSELNPGVSNSLGYSSALAPTTFSMQHNPLPSFASHLAASVPPRSSLKSRPRPSAPAGQPGDSSSSDSDSGKGGPKRNPFLGGPGRGMGGGGGKKPPTNPPRGNDTFSWDSQDDQGQRIHRRAIIKEFKWDPPHFDQKLKVDIIEEWDGNTDEVLDWIESINSLAKRSPIIFKQLGAIVPTRFKKAAKSWWLSLPPHVRDHHSEDWNTLKEAIRSYWMGRAWLDRMKLRAKACSYRDHTAPREKPTEYYIRKYRLLTSANNYSPSELIMAIMETAPAHWSTIIDTSTIFEVDELQSAIAYHEEALLHSFGHSDSAIQSLERRLRHLEQGSNRKIFTRANAAETRPSKPTNRFKSSKRPPTRPPKAKGMRIGAHKDIGPPPFPKDDSVVSRGRTPEQANVRPCRHCGSGKHWDYDCPHAKKGARIVRANFANPSPDYSQAQEEYDEAYYQESEAEEAAQKQESSSSEDYEEAEEYAEEDYSDEELSGN